MTDKPPTAAEMRAALISSGWRDMGADRWEPPACGGCGYCDGCEGHGAHGVFTRHNGRAADYDAALAAFIAGFNSARA